MNLPVTSPLGIEAYRRIVVLTGAGVSVASGLQTYRGAGGLWTSSDDAQYATADTLRSDPAGVWQFFAKLREGIALAQPNPAHEAIAAAERLLGPDASLTVITQNVDGLHQAAGSTHVIELHGSLRRTRCTTGDCTFQRDEDLAVTLTQCPACPACGAPLRAAVVLFGEPLPGDVEYFAKRSLRDCDLFIAIGTSGTVSPASGFVRSAAYVGARTVYVNTEPLADPSAFQESYVGRAEDLLPVLLGGESTS